MAASVHTQRPADLAGRLALGSKFPSARLPLAATCLSLILLTWTGLLASGCRPVPAARAVELFTGPIMGTTYEVKVVEDSMADARRQQVAAAIEERLVAVDAAMSTYREDSGLSRFNRHNSATPFTVSPATAQVVGVALDLGRATGGALDITVGPLVDAWGFGPGGQAEVPDAAQLEQLRSRTGLHLLELDRERHTLTKGVPELRCDLSAVAKGFAVDRVVEALQAFDIEHAMVEVGGEVRTLGRNGEGQVWRIAVEKPNFGVGGVQRVVALSDLAMATSGGYRNFIQVDGERLPHLLDPRTGWPVRHQLESVSVVAGTCLEADGLATALVVLGVDEGLALADRNGWAAYFLERGPDGQLIEHSSSAFGELTGRSAEPPRGG